MPYFEHVIVIQSLWNTFFCFVLRCTFLLPNPETSPWKARCVTLRRNNKHVHIKPLEGWLVNLQRHEMWHKCEVAFEEVTRPSNSMGFPIASRIVVVSTSFDFSYLMPPRTPSLIRKPVPLLGPMWLAIMIFARHITLFIWRTLAHVMDNHMVPHLGGLPTSKLGGRWWEAIPQNNFSTESWNGDDFSHVLGFLR